MERKETRKLSFEEMAARKQATLAVVDFVRGFHACLSGGSERLFSYLQDYTVLIWNGNKKMGAAEIVGFLRTFPVCSFRQATIDVLPLESWFLLSSSCSCVFVHWFLCLSFWQWVSFRFFQSQTMEQSRWVKATLDAIPNHSL